MADPTIPTSSNASVETVMAKFEIVRALMMSQFEAPEAVADLRAEVSRLATGRQTPDGWKLVPVEPTPEMAKAGYLYKHRDAYDPEADVYRAMLAIAPAAPSAAQGEVK